MSACYTSNIGPEEEAASDDKIFSRHHVLVIVNDEMLAAVEGWRQVHGLDQSEAFVKLIRLGLMSEIAKIYRLVADNRALASDMMVHEKGANDTSPAHGSGAVMRESGGRKQKSKSRGNRAEAGEDQPS